MSESHSDEPFSLLRIQARQAFTAQHAKRWGDVFRYDWSAMLALLDECDPGATNRPPTNGTQSSGLLFGLAMTAAVGVTQPVFVEIGTCGGGSLRVLCAVARRTGGHVFSMDPDEETVRAVTIPALEREGMGDVWTYIPKRSQEVAPRPADFLYVDGDHQYETVCFDMAHHASAVRAGGVILLDDVATSFRGKLRWVAERWAALQPIMVGPWAFWRHRPHFPMIYQRDLSAGSTVMWEV